MRMTTVVNVLTGETTQVEDTSPVPEQGPTPAPSLSRAEFVTALSMVPTPPIFTEDEALAALEAFPPKFTAALAGKPMAYRAEAIEAWRNAKTVSRYDPLFLDLLDFYAEQSGLDAKGAEDLGDSIFSVINEA